MTSGDIALWVLPVLLVVVAFFLKRLINGLEDAIKELKTAIERYTANQAACQLSLRAVYRTNDQAKQDWAEHKGHEEKQWGRIDDHEKRLTAMETACKINHD